MQEYSFRRNIPIPVLRNRKSVKYGKNRESPWMIQELTSANSLTRGSTKVGVFGRRVLQPQVGKNEEV